MNMNVKRTYAPPQVEAVELTPGGAILTGSETETKGTGINPLVPDYDDISWD